MDLIDGVVIRVGRRDFIVPPLNLKSIKRAQTLLPTLESDDLIASFDACVAIIHMAVARNYPDVTVDDLLEELDTKNVKGVVDAVLEASGFGPKAEPTPQTVPAESSAGTASTPDSPAPPDGAGSTSTST